jgi:hypothetical protein
VREPGVEIEIPRLADDLVAPACRIEGDDRRRPVRRAGAKDREPVLDHEAREVRERQIEPFEAAVRDPDAAELPRPALGEAGKKAGAAETAEPAHAKGPCRAGKFGGHRADG